ncbi:hypothetical protein AB4Z46_11020 [Variovorax sp. M-6]|uniref:hypothetical protein n=1 Tax=Variovorax sp. M-6 TaxID=3233041 RepID=UPI003F9AF8DF
MNLYQVLGARPGASPEELERAYGLLRARQESAWERLLRRCGTPSVRSLRIEHAFLVLRDPAARRRYDNDPSVFDAVLWC